MSSSPVRNRPHLERSPTWPPTIHVVTDGPLAHKSDSGSMSAAPQSRSRYSLFDDGEDLDEHPEQHFLSPMYEYEDWASDSDDDGDEIEWDAGITDFALLYNDRRRAQESHEQLDHRWDGFMSSQQSALQRAVQRSKTDAGIDTTRPPLPFEDLPGLTPDNSPNLRDDLDVDSWHGQEASLPRIPEYLTITVTPPSPEERTIEEEDDLPLSSYVDRSKPGHQAARKLERPGLRHARTMSGKVHSWRRPSWNIYSVGEDPDAERRAELGAMRRRDSSDDLRGRARRQS